MVQSKLSSKRPTILQFVVAPSIATEKVIGIAVGEPFQVTICSSTFIFFFFLLFGMNSTFIFH
jgi:hypothetical protein